MASGWPWTLTSQSVDSWGPKIWMGPGGRTAGMCDDAKGTAVGFSAPLPLIAGAAGAEACNCGGGSTGAAWLAAESVAIVTTCDTQPWGKSFSLEYRAKIRSFLNCLETAQRQAYYQHDQNI